jgi:NAD(P)-dependent dehydrogenase (short-subunit alcohol dehydrogenase family)
MESDLQGRRAHVTGGAQGIGLAIAERLAAAGARVAISDVNADGARAAAEGLEGDGHIGLSCDVRDTAQVRATIQETVSTFGGLDILVNNAGIEIGAPVTETDEDDFARLLDINVTGVHRCTRAAVPALAESGGNIVNIASVAGLGGCPLLSAYCASKAGVVRYTEVCAIELRQAGIRVNAVCPAFINTDMVKRLAPKVAEVVGLEFEEVVALKQGRYGTLEEVAEVTAFLAGDEAGWTTGAHYVLDGGLMGSLL